MSQNLLHDFLNLYFQINKLGNKVQGCIKKSIFFCQENNITSFEGNMVAYPYLSLKFELKMSGLAWVLLFVY